MNGRISARIACAVALGSVLLMMTSCLRETPGHCAFAEGDATCEEAFAGTFCIFQGPAFLDFAREEYRNVSEAQRLGCYESRPMTFEGEDMGLDRKFFGCVHDRLDEGEDLLGDLEALLKGQKGEETYDLPAFLDDHGITKEKHESGCRPEPGSTTTETSDSSSTITGSTITGSEGSTTDGSSSESSTTGPMRCMGNEDCTDAATPFCEPVTEMCVACDGMEDPDAACADLNSMAPLCVGGVCVPCTAHDQCSSGACELKVGLCFPSDAVRLEVDGDANMPRPPLYETITDAIDAVDGGTHGIIVVHELDGGADYGPTLTSAGKTIALLAAPGEVPTIRGNMNPGLRATEAGTILYVDGLTLAANAGNGTAGLGLRVDGGAFAWVDRSRIVDNNGGGIRVDNDAALTLRNCFVALNGGQFFDTRGVTASNASLDVAYTTIVANNGTGATGPISISCDATTSGSVRNSIVAAGDDTIACTNVTFSFNVVDTTGLAGTDNDVLSFNPAWFPDIAVSDFHIAAGPPFVDVARWQLGDPTTDIDDDPRPTLDGTADYAGADVP